MHIQLISGQYSPAEAIDLLTCLVDAKIKFLESKISRSQSEEDIHMRERRIIQLQNELADIRSNLLQLSKDVELDSGVHCAVRQPVTT